MDHVPHNEDGVGGMHVYMPWWLDNKKLDFPRGYHIEIGGGRRMPGVRLHRRHPQLHRHRSVGQPIAFGGYGKQLKDDYRRYYGATVELRRPRRDDPERGLLLRDRSDASSTSGASRCCASTGSGATTRYKQVEAHAGDLPRASSTRWAARRSRRCRRRRRATASRPAAGSSTSSACTRMGNDPSTSVLNSNCQAHDVKNLFVADGGPFVSQADKNCTWTILALSMRTSEYIADERKTGDAVSDHRIAGRRCRLHRRPRRWPRRFAWTEAEAAQAHEHAQAARAAAAQAGAPYKPKFFTAHEWATVRVLVDIIIPKDERSGSATDAGVPEFMDFIDRRPAGAADRDARRARLARPSSASSASTSASSTAPPRSARRCSTTSPGRSAPSPRFVARRRVLQQLPRPDRDRVLDHQDGHAGPAVHGQHVRRPNGRVPGRGAEEAGNHAGLMRSERGTRDAGRGSPGYRIRDTRLARPASRIPHTDSRLEPVLQRELEVPLRIGAAVRRRRDAPGVRVVVARHANLESGLPRFTWLKKFTDSKRTSSC